MSDSGKPSDQSSENRQNEYVTGGKGRKDEVGGSGIYPASVPDAPGDAVLRGEGELVGHTKPPHTPVKDDDVKKSDRSPATE